MTKETILINEKTYVSQRLQELDLRIEGLERVALVALGASSDVTSLHPINAAGTMSYQQGTWALRDEFVGEKWSLDRNDGIESIVNETKKIKIAFANVDIACNEHTPPKPRSKKGAGSERACNGNLFSDLPNYFQTKKSDYTTYYFMLDADGRAELTCPIIKANTFSSYVERIFIGDIAEVSVGNIINESDSHVEIEPIVVRK